ncbi:MAG TPA: hypothetical protein VGP72_10440 [Planctomycetota bacterium]|jgi:hypothetical protein
MAQTDTQGQGDKAQPTTAAATTNTEAQRDNGAATTHAQAIEQETVSREEYEAILQEKNDLAKALRLSKKASGSGINPEDVSRMQREIEGLKSKAQKAEDRLKVSTLRSVASDLGFNGERAEAFLAIVKDKAGQQIQVTDDDAVVYYDTAKKQATPIADYLKALAPSYDYLKPPQQTPAVRGIQPGKQNAVPTGRRYSEMSQSERLSLTPEQRRQLARAEIGGA